MHRTFVALRGASVVLLIGLGLQLTAGSAASGAINAPGQISVTPESVVEGSSGNTLTFSYSPGPHQLANGTVTVKIPTGWTLPATNAPGAPGNVQVSTGTVVVTNRLITDTKVTLCESSCSWTLTYSDAYAPATVGTATFATKISRAGHPLKPLVPTPSVMITQSSGSCIPKPATATSDGVSMTVTPGTCLNGGTVTSLTGSGFDPQSLGIVLECNDTSDQPTVTMSILGNSETLPVSCSGFAVSRAIETTSTGAFGPGATFSAIAGTTGPPCGPGDLVATCPADSTGGNAVADAANFPCPPTAAQAAAGATCTISYGGFGGKSQTVAISFLPTPAPNT